MVGSGQPDRTVVTVINYKGGVGKTTLAANIGAELAYRGKTILLIDLDPQASLTFSLYDPVVWERELADERTILQWFGGVLSPESAEPLSKFVSTPPAVNAVIAGNGKGRLDLVASHLGLIDVDLDFAAELGGSRFQHGSPRYLELHRSLAEALAEEPFAEYDLVLIDCAPNFTMVTRAGIVASDYLVVPAKPDYISTLGIDFLRKKLSELVHEYNRVAPPGDLRIDPRILGIVYTMVQYASAGPINVQKNYLRLGEQIEVPVFRQTVRENKTTFGNAGEGGIPAVLSPTANDAVRYELQQLGVELLAKIRI
ncbi:ParA family protein [Virgisporangium aurantiacum]|uniref:Cobyrinic acid a,c-diamide synthase n=1 Tax=Virgisporangium aurantiacum TaxID=175570 RepID=A0A8J3Z8D9_9ACTN|nr:AAA family ATPase [Virgisporangium aurantiacum]GIJ58282.1 cobyrinic acid a,c-diamide synthase [Virgisporangium aurantiacum]